MGRYLPKKDDLSVRHGKRYRIPEELLNRWPTVVSSAEPEADAQAQRTGNGVLAGTVTFGKGAVAILPTVVNESWRCGEAVIPPGAFLDVLYSRRDRDKAAAVRLEQILLENGAEVVAPYALFDDP